MSPAEVVIIKAIQSYGWTVVRCVDNYGHSWWQADSANKQVKHFSCYQLLEEVLKDSETLEAVLSVKTITKGDLS